MAFELTPHVTACHTRTVTIASYMLELTREQFGKPVLDRAHLRREYFDDEGRIRSFIYSMVMEFTFFLNIFSNLLKISNYYE